MKPGDRVVWKAPNGTQRPGTVSEVWRDPRADDPTAIVHVVVDLDYVPLPLRVTQLDTLAPLGQAPVRLDAAGTYDVLGDDGEPLEDPPTAIVKSDWQGPEGGRCVLWEVVTHDEHGWTIQGDVPPGNTLREARENLWLAGQP